MKSALRYAVLFVTFVRLPARTTVGAVCDRAFSMIQPKRAVIDRPYRRHLVSTHLLHATRGVRICRKQPGEAVMRTGLAIALVGLGLAASFTFNGASFDRKHIGTRRLTSGQYPSILFTSLAFVPAVGKLSCRFRPRTPALNCRLPQRTVEFVDGLGRLRGR